jgi:hypothetical protein
MLFALTIRLAHKKQKKPNACHEERGGEPSPHPSTQGLNRKTTEPGPQDQEMNPDHRASRPSISTPTAALKNESREFLHTSKAGSETAGAGMNPPITINVSHISAI